MRWITQDLPGEVARELFAARDADAGEQQQTVILARALGHSYFREWGRRAHGLHIVFSDVDPHALCSSSVMFSGPGGRSSPPASAPVTG
ncbi:hypothetical protein [Streptomyces sp. OM5714]|uniref:hypothetical protein n=1 Tax=Streptomyces sp. OM5714 TaxID=2602736 RepID=UPI001F0920EC|nr:hypothetical protein [Streptomyces sp. OM5714]